MELNGLEDEIVSSSLVYDAYYKASTMVNLAKLCEISHWTYLF